MKGGEFEEVDLAFLLGHWERTVFS